MKLPLLCLLFVPHTLPAPPPRPLQVGDRAFVVQDKRHGDCDEIGPNGSAIGIVVKVEHRIHVETDRWIFTVPESMVRRVGR